MFHGALCWGGSRSTKPCVFPCTVAAASDGTLKAAPVCCGCGSLGSKHEAVSPLRPANRRLLMHEFYAIVKSLVADCSVRAILFVPCPSAVA